jgi:predicted DNA-binding transcriptional regulator
MANFLKKNVGNCSVCGDCMAGKDQAVGGVIFIVCVVVAVIYAATLFYPHWLSILGVNASSTTVQFWTVAIPVFVAFIAIMAIGAWIDWTMATTPPPKPIDEIEAETKSEAEEKTNAHAER